MLSACISYYLLLPYRRCLSGSVPPELGNLTNLTYLSLGGNSFSGIIPSELDNLKRLTYLNLNENRLAGPLPQWLSDMGKRFANTNFLVTDAVFPSTYNGVTPDPSFEVALEGRTNAPNNIGEFSASNSTIYTCLRVYTDGLPRSVGGIGKFDIALKYFHSMRGLFN